MIIFREIMYSSQEHLKKNSEEPVQADNKDLNHHFNFDKILGNEAS